MVNFAYLNAANAKEPGKGEIVLHAVAASRSSALAARLRSLVLNSEEAPSMKKLVSAAAFIALMSLPVVAQTAAPTSPADQNAPAEVTSPAPAPAPAKRLAGDISANKLINESITNAANETIGDINDLLISGDGKISAVVVGVGGFLGLGEKNVALPFDQLVLAKDADGDLSVSTSMTKESLQSAPEYVKPENR